MTLPVRCAGVTRKGTRCSITGASRLTDDRGRLVSEPLVRGSHYCRFHAAPFCTQPAGNFIGPSILLLIDLETTGLDVAEDQIVEIAACHVPRCPLMKGAAFSTTVCADRSDSASQVHGILPSEIAAGPSFPVAWSRLVAFVEHLQCCAVMESSDSDCEPDDNPLRPSSDLPTVVLAGHNSFRFDMPVILFECSRHGCSWSALAQWLYVDTIHVVQAAGVQHFGGCLKLQCLVNGRCAEPLHAHRALDDCIALRSVLESIAARCGVALDALITPLAVRLDVEASAAQMSTM